MALRIISAQMTWIGLVRRATTPTATKRLLRDAYACGQEHARGPDPGNRAEALFQPSDRRRSSILAEMQMDDATIVTALLHEHIEDTKANFAEVERRFGTVIAETGGAVSPS